MGYKLLTFTFTPAESQQIEATITLPREKRSILYGVVQEEDGTRIPDAIIALFTSPNQLDIEPVTHTFSDENGLFTLGPLTPGITYIVKVWSNHIHVVPFPVYPYSPGE